MNHKSALNLGVAISGPMIVVMIRLVGQGAEPAAAQHITQTEASEPDQFIEMTQHNPELYEAWDASVRSSLRPPPGVDAGEMPLETPQTNDPQSPPIYEPVVYPEYTLSAIIANGSRGAAVLDDKITWVGSELGGGWVLEGVDNQSRTVMLRHRTGKTHKIEFDDGR